MKKRICLFLAVVLLLGAVSCGQTENANAEPEKKVEPQFSQMQTICELATAKCYYHNVAKYFEKDTSGFLFWKKDKHFWIEYAGVVTIGIDTSQLRMEIEDDTVKITIPKARVMDCVVDDSTLTKESFIVDPASDQPTATDQQKAFQEAQNNMKQAASDDAALLANARERAKKLLEDYVKNIGTITGKEYKVKWIYPETEKKASTTSEQAS